MKKIVLSLFLSGTFLYSEVIPVIDNSLIALTEQIRVQNQVNTHMLAQLNWSMGAANSFFGQVGATKQMYEDYLNSLGLGGSKLGRYTSNLVAECIGDKAASLSKLFNIPDVTVCGINVAADLSNYLGDVLNSQLNKILKSIFGKEPEKKKSSTNPKSPGTEDVKKITDSQLASNITGKGKIRAKDENGDEREFNISKENINPNGNKTYKDSMAYIIDNSILNTTKGNTVNDFLSKSTAGDKENLGNLDSPLIRSFYSKMAKQYTQVNKFHREQFLRHTYVLKRVEDFFNTTFVKNNDRNKAEEYTIDIPLPLADVVPGKGNGEQGCILMSDAMLEKVGRCSQINFGISFIPQRSIVENPDSTLEEYTNGLKNVGNKILKKLLPNGTEASREFIKKFDIKTKISEIKRKRGYNESGINFATLSELITSYADIASKLINLKSTYGRDVVKVNYLKAILYQLTILNEQIYLYNKINSEISLDRYNEMYIHILNIEKELQKIRIYETFYLRKILLK